MTVSVRYDSYIRHNNMQKYTVLVKSLKLLAVNFIITPMEYDNYTQKLLSSCYKLAQIILKRLFSILLFLLITIASSFCQENYLPFVPKTVSPGISPLYFGPNAFPVPDILKNTTDKLEVEIMASGALGHLTNDTDRTLSADFSFHIPMWTDRVNFSAWGHIYECYYDPESTQAARRVNPILDTHGSLNGDIYFSMDARVLNEGRIHPCIVLRAALKTASGGQFYKAREYDSPGYFFDASFSKDFTFGHGHGISTTLSTGFLCWQIDNGRQNDAVMYGISTAFHSKKIKVSADFGGYIGWRGDGDTPMTLKIRADIIPDRMLSPFIAYQHGFKCWPFDQLKTGIKGSFRIMK